MCKEQNKSIACAFALATPCDNSPLTDVAPYGLQSITLCPNWFKYLTTIGYNLYIVAHSSTTPEAPLTFSECPALKPITILVPPHLYWIF